MAEIAELVLCKAPLQIGAGVNAGRSVPLKIDQIAGLLAVAAMKEVIETDFEQCRERGISGDMPAYTFVVFVLIGTPLPSRSSESGF